MSRIVKAKGAFRYDRWRIRCGFLLSLPILLAALSLSTVSHANERDSASETYFAANALFNRALYDLAVEQYRTFLARHPGHAKFLHARLGLALSLYELRRFEDAGQILAQLAQEREAPHLETVHNLLGQCLLVANRAAEAENAFRWVVNRGRERFFVDLPGVSAAFHESPAIAAATISDLEPLERGYAGLIEALYQQGKWREVVDACQEMLRLVEQGTYSNRTRFLLALAYYELREYGQAIPVLNELQASPDAGAFLEHATFLLAECHREVGSLAEASLHHQQVARSIRGQFVDNALFRLGYIRFLQSEYKQAITDFSDLRTLYPDSSYVDQAGLFLGRSHLEVGAYAHAQAVFGQLSASSGVASEATLWLGKTFLRQKDFSGAISVLKPSLRRFLHDPFLPQLLFDLGNAHFGLAQYEEATALFSEVESRFPQSNVLADSLRLRSFSQHRQAKYADSLETAERFLQNFARDPHGEDVAFLKAENLFFLGRYSQAIPAYRQFIPWEGTRTYTAEARYRIVQSLMHLREYSDALREMEPLLRNRPEGSFFDQLTYLAGIASFHLERWNESREHLRRFTELHPDRPNADNALVILAQGQTRLRQFPEAIATLRQLIRHYPDSPHLAHGFAELGTLLYNTGEFSEAGRQFTELASRFPETELYPLSQYYLGWIALQDSRKDRALSHFTTVIRYFPEHEAAPDSLYQLALIELEAERFQEAEAHLRRHLEAYPGQSPDLSQFHLGIVLSRQGRYEQAAALFSNFVQEYPQSTLVPRAQYEWAWCARSLGRNQVARDRYLGILENWRGSELADQARFELADLEYHEKNFDKAIELLDTLLARPLPPDLKQQVMHRLGWCFMGRDQVVAAAEMFERLLAEFPQTAFLAVASYQAGEVRLSRREHELAYQHFLRANGAVREAGLRAQILLRLGETQCLTGRWEAASTTFASFLKELPEHPLRRRAHLWLGWSLENQRNFNDAMHQYRLVLAGNERDELSARSQFQIGQCLEGLGEFSLAVTELVKVDAFYDFPQWSARALLEIGRLLDREGRREEANERYKEVVRRFRDADEATVARELLLERNIFVAR